MAKLKVTYSDSRVVEVNAGPRAEVALERKFDMSAGEMNRNEHIYYIGWAALHFSGQEPDDFETFLERIEDVDIVEEQKEPGPTQRARRRPTSSD